MTALVSGPEFARKAGIRIGIFLVLTFGFPFILQGIIAVTGARSVGGASGAVATLASIVLKPLIVGGFILSMISPCWRRMRSLGIPGYWGLIVPLLLALDAAFLALFGAYWGMAFVMGAMRPMLPMYALIALVLVVAMSFAGEPDSGEPPGLARFGIAGTATMVLAVCFSAIAVLMLVTTWSSTALVWSAPKQVPLRGGSPAFWTLLRAADWIRIPMPSLAIALSAAVAWLTILSRWPRGDEPTANAPPSPPTGNTSPRVSPGQPRAAFGRR